MLRRSFLKLLAVGVLAHHKPGHHGGPPPIPPVPEPVWPMVWPETF